MTTNGAIRNSMPNNFKILTAGTYTNENFVAIQALEDTVLGATNIVSGQTKDLSTAESIQESTLA